jgi:hypothetical protein
MNYYEPHGYKYKRDMNFIRKLLKKIKHESNDQILFNYKLTEIGSQIIAKDQVGFCIMFSCFWIHIIFSIINYNLKNNSYITSNYWIDKVENYYISVLSEKDLYDAIVCFSYYFFENNFSEFDKEGKIDFIYKFVSGLKDVTNEKKELNFETTMVVPKEVKIKEHEDTYSSKQLKKLAKSNPELTYYTWEERRLKELNKIKKIKNEIERRKKLIGDECVNNEDCFSGKCKITKRESYCVP